MNRGVLRDDDVAVRSAVTPAVAPAVCRPLAGRRAGTSAAMPRRWCEPVGVIFGDHVRPAATAAAAAWIAGARRGAWGTIGALVPDRYRQVLRVHAPPPSPEGWWPAYRHLYEIVAEVGARHTSSPDRAWYAIWDGHGFDSATTHVGWRDPPPDDATRRAREAERARLRDEDARRHAATRAELARLPRFELPHRTYYLLEGSVAAVTTLRDPGPSSAWRNPDLFWPDDRRWFVATDVDVWSLYVGGDDDLIRDIAVEAPTRTEIVTLDDPLEIED